MNDFDFSISQQKALAIIPMITGTLSLLGSGLITFMIFKSKKKISTPFRRIILGLSVSDISVSLAYMCSTLPAIKGSSWNSQGNQTTCNIQGIFFLIGIVGVPFYILALTSYYLCVAKYALSDQVIARKVEPFFHITGVLWVITSSIYFLLAGSLSPGTTMCWIKKEAYLERWIFVGGPVLLCFIGVCVNMFLIYRTAATQAKKTNKYTFQHLTRASKVSLEQPSPSNEGRTSISSILSPRALMLSFRRKSSLNSARGSKERQAMIQALFYVSAFFISFIWSYIIIIYEKKAGERSFVLSILSRLFQPMLGLFNVLIYTRYHVASVRSMYPEKNWFQAFFFAVKSAGDNEEFREETAQRRLKRRIEKRNSLKTMNLITTGQETSVTNTDRSNRQTSGPPSLEGMVKFPLQTNHNSKRGEESHIGDLEKGDDPVPKNNYDHLMRQAEYSEEEKCEEGLDHLPQDHIRYSNVDANEDDEEIFHEKLEDDLSVNWKGQRI